MKQRTKYELKLIDSRLKHLERIQYAILVGIIALAFKAFTS